MFGLARGSRQDSWPHHRNPYFRVTLVVVVLHLVLFVFAPPFHFKPYRLEAQEVMQLEEVPDIVLPRPVPPEPKPPVDVTPWDDPIGGDTKPPQNVLYGDDKWPKPPVIERPTARRFVPYDKEPVLKTFVKLEYPNLAREAGIEGVVMVQVRIDEAGKVTSAVVVTSDVTEAMNRAALAAARECEFEPALQGQKPVPVAVVIPFAFRLDQR
jgi:protein TonB